jgi:hypothetical protein
MFEQLRKELETEAMVKFNDGRTVYGIVLDYFLGESKIENLKFVPNQFLELYRATENQQLVITLDSRSVKTVDVSLK